MRPRPGRRPRQNIAKSAPQALLIMNRSSRGVTSSGGGSVGGAETGAAAGTAAGAATHAGAAPDAAAMVAAPASASRHGFDNVRTLRRRQANDAEPPGGMPAQCTW